MKKNTKLMRIALITMLCAVCFAGCTPQAEEELPPVVEIVERTDLLDFIRPDMVFTGREKQALEAAGITAAIQNPRLSGENSVTFDMVMANNRGGEITITVTGRLDYDKNGEKFENVRLYWGGLFAKGQEILIYGITDLTHVDFTTGTPDIRSTSLADSEISGTVLKAIPTDRSITAVMAAEDADYLVEWNYFDDFSRFKKLSLTPGTLSTDDSRGVMPFDIDNRPDIHRLDDELLITGDGSAVYAYKNGSVSYGTKLGYASSGDISMALYNLYGYNSRISRFVAVKKEGGVHTPVVLDSALLGGTRYEKTLYAENGYMISVPATGLELDVDFENRKPGRLRYKITQDMLGEKLYTSPDKKYELYQYAPEMENGVDSYSVALFEKATGKITNLGFVGTIGTQPGETGFDPNGNPYIYNSNDLYIYTTNVDSPTPVFKLSEHFSMDSDTYLLAACYNEKTQGFAVVHYTQLQEEMKYIITVFDKFGNRAGAYDTEIGVFGTDDIVTIYPKGTGYGVSVTGRGTGEIAHKLTVTADMFK